LGIRSRDDAQRYAELFDPVTRLPRPALLWDRVGMALARAERERRLVGVLHVSVDVCSDYERRRGGGLDMLLLLAGRLRSLVRPDDTVGRIGAHDFVIVCNGLSTDDELGAIDARIHAVVGLPIYFDDQRTPVTATVRTTLAAPGDDPGEILSRWDSSREVAVSR
jgi:diguanylate cyclase (GGDEF)-like protein